MTDINKIFYELTRVSIGTGVCLSRMPSAAEWQTLYDMALKQSILGICFAGVQRLKKQQQAPPEMLYLKWMGMVAMIQQKNELLNHRCVEVQRMLTEEGMKSCILKGQGVARLYDFNVNDNGNGNLGVYRQSGDIDVWVDGGMEKALGWCRKKFGDVDYDYINAHVPEFMDVEVELHWRVQSMTNLFRNRRLQRWLEREQTKEMILGGRAILPDGGEITVPTPEFNAFYLMLHCYNHEFSSGLGLRQLTDYYFLLMARNDLNINKNDNRVNFDNFIINRLFKEFGMERFARAVMWIMQEVFGLERERLLCEPDEKEGRYILSEVMAGGNFGHHDESIRKVGKGKWRSVLANLQHAMHVLSRYPSEALWMPVWIAYHFIWKRTLKTI